MTCMKLSKAKKQRSRQSTSSRSCFPIRRNESSRVASAALRMPTHLIIQNWSSSYSGTCQPYTPSTSSGLCRLAPSLVLHPNRIRRLGILREYLVLLVRRVLLLSRGATFVLRFRSGNATSVPLTLVQHHSNNSRSTLVAGIALHVRLVVAFTTLWCFIEHVLSVFANVSAPFQRCCEWSCCCWSRKTSSCGMLKRRSVADGAVEG